MKTYVDEDPIAMF